ncbi:MAG: MarR family transcriptional regulator [Oscillospiraceae bacterium]|jgi:DNA-binding MarR family transcriptional regulator|nr:MarR family transcriptional regulator [Oscillospiraceae bacterium]
MSDKNYDTLRLENQLCFPLYACSREVIKRYRPYLDAVGLTYTQYVAMMVLWAEKTVSVKALGEKLYLDSGTLTPVLKSLEAKGYITRTRSTEDERVLLASLTEKGMHLRDEAETIPQQIGTCIRLTPEEAMTLYRLLYKLLGTLE